MIERSKVLNTFLLSKFWYLANFYYYNNNQLKFINKKIYRFLWSSKSERIKRDSIIMPYENGGLNFKRYILRIL
jgi:hypothetical protein